MTPRTLRLISAALISVILFTAVGCYGSFNLVKKVYRWNGTLGDKWVNEVAFVALNIVPVYGISAAIDALLLNSLEFWTGKNPVVATTDSTIELRDDDVTLRISVSGDGAMVTDVGGNILARSIRTKDGVVIYDGTGNMLGGFTNDQIASAIVNP